ncbi:MAG: serine protease [Bacteroidales bacterium]|nr:serine protease [Bacteroidales bacterium]
MFKIFPHSKTTRIRPLGVLLIFITLFSIRLQSQEVDISVIFNKDVAIAHWQIVDESHQIIYSNQDLLQEDTVYVMLDAEKRFYFELSIDNILKPDTALCSILINNEPILLILSGISQGDHSYPFYTGTKTPQLKIIGGDETDISDFPWQVYLQAGMYMCGGSIISERWILTAAHCTKNALGGNISASQMLIKAGATNPNNPSEGKLYKVSEVIIHSNYNNYTFENDIALLKLEEAIDIENAEAIKIISANDVEAGYTDPGVMAWITGWGLVNVSPNELPDNLQKVQLPIVSSQQASTVWGNIPSTIIMAGYINGNKDACNGDSGGPLTVPTPEGYKLAGIVSWGNQNCNTYGGYTRVSSYESWIRAKTGIEDRYLPQKPQGETIICMGTALSEYIGEYIPDASSYEWIISPSEAGKMEYTKNYGHILWNTNYSGLASIQMRVVINNEVSGWSSLDIKVAENTVLLNQSEDKDLCIQEHLDLFVEVQGNNLTYDWYKDNNLIQSGASPNIEYLNSQPYHSGTYECLINGTCGSITSEKINVSVLPQTKITSLSPDVEVNFGNQAILAVHATGHNLQYQWEKNSEPIWNENYAELMLQDVNANTIDFYQVTVTGTCGVEQSDSVYVFVAPEQNTEEQMVFMWPTVADDHVNIAMENDEFYYVQLFNNHGELIYNQANCRYRTILNLAHLMEGVYMVNVYNTHFKETFKLIIK